MIFGVCLRGRCLTLTHAARQDTSSRLRDGLCLCRVGYKHRMATGLRGDLGRTGQTVPDSHSGEQVGHGRSPRTGGRSRMMR
jgi:hypothetical protein